MRTDRQTDVTNLTVYFRNITDAPKNGQTFAYTVLWAESVLRVAGCCCISSASVYTLSKFPNVHLRVSYFESYRGRGREAYMLWCTNWDFMRNIANIIVRVQLCTTSRQLLKLLKNCVDWRQDQLLQSRCWRLYNCLKHAVRINTHLYTCEGITLQCRVNLPGVNCALLYRVWVSWCVSPESLAYLHSL